MPCLSLFPRNVFLTRNLLFKQIEIENVKSLLYNIVMIGIYGGAFDPPHTEHRRIVNEIMREFHLDKVILVPSGISPHKDLYTSFEVRKEMVRAAFSGTAIEIDDIESRYSSRAYSSELLPILKKKYGDIVFIIGGDSLLHFDRWHEPNEILKICPLIVVPRGKEDLDILRSAARRFIDLWGGEITISEKIRGAEISSSELRAAVELGYDHPSLDPAVTEIIERNGLYRTHSAMIDRVRSALPEKRWDHTCKVVLTGLKLNAELGLPSESVFVACLLHDCMKYSEYVHEGVPQDSVGTKVMHAFNGAEEARVAYGITDEDVVNAIRYHTTGRKGMSTLEKLVYLADMIEPNRHFDGVDELRSLTEKNFELGFEECIRRSYRSLEAKGKPIYYLTVECYEYYCKGDENGER